MFRYLLPAMLLIATAAAAAPVCDGQYITIRVSKLKAGGTMTGFAEAAKANADWYKAKGLTDNMIVTAPIMTRAGGVVKASAGRIATLHVNGAKAPEHKGDAGWDAFVAKYQANSTIESETRLCLPKGTMLVAR